MKLEQIVRPFQRTNTLAHRRIIATNTKVDVPKAVLTWGAAGTLPQAHEIEDVLAEVTIKWPCDDDFEEVEREEQELRIEKPDDPDTYLIYNRPTKISIKKKTKKKKRVTYNADGTSSGGEDDECTHDVTYKYIVSG